MDNDWIRVDSYKDIPVGLWLVETEGERQCFHVADINKNISIVGGCFAFERPKVIAYKDIGLNEVGK